MEVLVIASFGLKAIPGLELNNYMHIKQNPGDPWRGSMLENGKLVVDEHNHAGFIKPMYGLRAGIRVISSYVVEHQLNTIRGIVRRFTNVAQDWPGYEAFLAKALAWDVDKQLRIFDKAGRVLGPVQLETLIRAMCEVEIFRGFVVPDDEWQNALALYNMHFAPKG